ncbi:unnamed protein product [Bursaphelenchus okinawaensis]|uniref:NAD-dependent protein deacetylase n=1 Tax=Bursaphelenchus okinawaensis TaxID=465554 RepID=A0A811L885_9BILA|nr:unnamed protein product [Bursaphelenchus okinawaensis]CAG9118667.1 unnamed protein product [Bursaphelenchus okinawaensis]
MADKDELLPTSSTAPKKQPEQGGEKPKQENPAEFEQKEEMPGKIPNLYNKFVQSFENALNTLTTEPEPKCPLKSFDLEGVAQFIQARKARNIVFMVGAGISTSAGVPDFRSPKTGLYSNLDKYKLPDPQAIFDLDFFKDNPVPFYQLARELFPEHLKPTPCHYFMRLLDEKGYLRRIYTQNIDSLEWIAGINKDKVIYAHGSHQTSSCLKCKKKYDLDWITDFLNKKEPLVPYCSCKGLIKPDIVFFGENLPSKFFTSAVNDFPKCDLLIIIGTSLVVQPFASMVHEVAEETPRLLINLTSAGKISKRERAQGYQGLTYEDKDNFRDVFWKGCADEGIFELAELLGLKDELHHLIQKEHEKIDRKATEKSNQAPKSTEDVAKVEISTGKGDKIGKCDGKLDKTGKLDGNDNEKAEKSAENVEKAGQSTAL